MNWLIIVRSFAVAVWMFSVLGGLACLLFLELPAFADLAADSRPIDAGIWFLFATVPTAWVFGPLLYILVSALQPDLRQRYWLAGVLVASGWASLLASQGHLGHVWAPDLDMRVIGGLAILIHVLALQYCFRKVLRDSRILKETGATA